MCGGGTEIFEQSIVNAVTTAGNGGGEGAGFTRAPTSFVPYVTGKQATLANRGVKETSRKFPQYDKELYSGTNIVLHSTFDYTLFYTGHSE